MEQLSATSPASGDRSCLSGTGSFPFYSLCVTALCPPPVRLKTFVLYRAFCFNGCSPADLEDLLVASTPTPAARWIGLTLSAARTADADAEICALYAKSVRSVFKKLSLPSLQMHLLSPMG